MVMYGAVSEDLRFPAFQTSAVWMILCLDWRVVYGGTCFGRFDLPFAMCHVACAEEGVFILI